MENNMATKITRERLHSIIDDSIENGADTLIIASKKNGKMYLIVGHFDTEEYEWLSTKITTELKISNGDGQPQEDDLEWGETHQ